VTGPPPGGDDDGRGTPRIRPFLFGSAEPDRPVSPGAPPSGPRPYVLTAGRTEAADPLIGVETQVTARLGQSQSELAPELAAIVELCAEPTSVAEIAARLRLHLGVARILVGDLRAAGHLDVHTVDVTRPHDPDTILRVMRGLRAIT
jgi:hypothetical protein